MERIRVILYARVSTKEQAEEGYSLEQQLEALSEYADEQGYEVVDVARDPGYSGAKLERPGLDRVRDLVAAGGGGHSSSPRPGPTLTQSRPHGISEVWVCQAWGQASGPT